MALAACPVILIVEWIRFGTAKPDAAQNAIDSEFKARKAYEHYLGNRGD